MCPSSHCLRLIMSAVSPTVPNQTTASPLVAWRWLDVFIRMLWKELRVLRPFWFTVVGMIIAFGGLLLWLGKRDLWLGKGETWRDGALAVMATIFSLMYALGCGAMSYANEREEGTWDLLRRMSAPSSAVCAAKLLAGLSSSLLLAAISWSTLLWLTPSLPQLTQMTGLSFLLLVSGIFVLSQAVSVLTRSVLWALMLATVLGLPFGGFLMAIAENAPLYQDQEHLAAVQVQVQRVLAAMVAGGCCLVSLQ